MSLGVGKLDTASGWSTVTGPSWNGVASGSGSLSGVLSSGEVEATSNPWSFCSAGNRNRQHLPVKTPRPELPRLGATSLRGLVSSRARGLVLDKHGQETKTGALLLL